MDKVLKFLVAIIGLMCLAMWALWVFSFDGALQQWSVQAVTTYGMNNLRGDIGGMFLALATFCGLYFSHGKIWLKAAIVLTGSIAMMRVLSLLVDGYDQAAVQALAVEIAFIIVFLLAPERHRH